MPSGVRKFGTCVEVFAHGKADFHERKQKKNNTGKSERGSGISLNYSTNLQATVRLADEIINTQ